MVTKVKYRILEENTFQILMCLLMYFVYCLYCGTEETQPLRPDGPRLGLPDLANKNTGCPVISEFQTDNG